MFYLLIFTRFRCTIFLLVLSVVFPNLMSTNSNKPARKLSSATSYNFSLNGVFKTTLETSEEDLTYSISELESESTQQELPKNEKIKVEKSSNLLFGYSVLAKSMMGSGIIGLAFACSKMGWFLGIFLLIFSGICTVFSLNLLTELSIKNHSFSERITLFDLSNNIWPNLTKFVDAVVIIKAILGSIGYLILSGKTTLETSLVFIFTRFECNLHLHLF